jgi:hypothetical protein
VADPDSAGAGVIDNQHYAPADSIHVFDKLVDADDWYAACTKPSAPPALVHIMKEGFSPFQPFVEGLDPREEAFKQEVLRIWGRTYENLYAPVWSNWIKNVA